MIEIDKMKFGAAPAGIHAGDTIIWKNADLVKHTATARDGSFDIDLPRKSQDSMIVKNTGTVDVYCRYHPGMIMIPCDYTVKSTFRPEENPPGGYFRRISAPAVFHSIAPEWAKSHDRLCQIFGIVFKGFDIVAASL
ncbi:hypothetical protein [Parvibaculum sp.]|uniref:hypothetical protein n=1 Tax=Parvibaculum sp. TaxID=2024848 RepID=UPI003BA91780